MHVITLQTWKYGSTTDYIYLHSPMFRLRGKRHELLNPKSELLLVQDKTLESLQALSWLIQLTWIFENRLFNIGPTIPSSSFHISCFQHLSYSYLTYDWYLSIYLGINKHIFLSDEWSWVQSWIFLSCYYWTEAWTTHDAVLGLNKWRFPRTRYSESTSQKVPRKECLFFEAEVLNFS